MNQEPVKVDVWSDVVCPWCYIGKRRLEEALEDLAASVEDPPPVVTEFHSFQLDPHMPENFEGTPADYLARHKGISRDQAAQMQRQVARVAAGAGLEYHFDLLKPANSLKAHQLLHFAKNHGRQLEAKEALMRAHFVEGRHVGRDEQLAEVAREVGLRGADFLSALGTEEFLPAVRADEQLAAQIGIRGVPFFVVDGRFGISGAQQVEVFTQTLERALADRRTSGG